MDRACSIPEEERRIAEDFELFDEPRERIEYLLELGKGLPPLDDAEKIETNKVRGCQSQVWMVAEYDPGEDRLHIRADSDAFIVRGLIGLLLRLYSDRSPREILDHPPHLFERIGLASLLTPGRQNGLYSMVERIRELARIYTAHSRGATAGAASNRVV